MRDIRFFIPAALFVLLLTACLSCVTPCAAHAATVPDNQNGVTCKELAANDTMQNNYGTIDLNSGEIINNYSVVRVNNGIIENNFSWNAYTDERIGKDGGSGTITYNYFVDELLFGKSKNNFYKVVGTRIEVTQALDWSLNPDKLSAGGKFYVGASSNEDESLRGATFKAAEGYSITLKPTINGNYKATDNADGTYSITVTNPNYRGEINIEDLFEVKKTLSISVSTTPAEGGSIIHANGGEPFISGDYSYDTSLFLEAKANEGYRFVGWVGIPEQDYVSSEGNKLIIDFRMSGRYENIQSISCVAEFEKIPSSNNDPEASGPASADSSNDESNDSESILPPTGDNYSAIGLLFICILIASGALAAFVLNPERA